jgi:hypothetical protein
VECCVPVPGEFIPEVDGVEDCCVAGAVEEMPVDMVVRPKDVKSWDDSPPVVEPATTPSPVQVTYNSLA